jgi:hypothetical protein
MAEESKTLVPIEQKVVEFYGDELPVLRDDTEGKSIIYAPIRPICDYLGINWSAQYRCINRNPVLSAKPVPCVVVTTTAELQQVRENALAVARLAEEQIIVCSTGSTAS